jgi:ubiquinone/menaquinone biosynthesis C-methylase UbiE
MTSERSLNFWSANNQMHALPYFVYSNILNLYSYGLYHCVGVLSHSISSNPIYMPELKEIIDYYNASKLDYQLYSGSFDNISMHFGLWDETTHSHAQALLNENRVLAKLAQIIRKNMVIDLGCGYGSTAVWLASHIGCHVTGITIPEKQVAAAQQLAKKFRVENLTTFLAMDYHHTSFPDNCFDTAVAIESISHSSDKPLVLKEIHRILKPGGMIAIADGYFGKDKNALTPFEQSIANSCFKGVHVPPLPEKTEFEQDLKNAGFIEIEWLDKTQSILPISRRVHRLAKAVLPISKILGFFGMKALSTTHIKAFLNQYYAWRDGLGLYGIFLAKK